MRFKDDERVGGWKQIGSTRFQGYEISQIKGEFYLWIRGEERAKAGVSARRRAGFAEFWRREGEACGCAAREAEAG